MNEVEKDAHIAQLTAELEDAERRFQDMGRDYELLRYRNYSLADKFDELKSQVADLRAQNTSLAESLASALRTIEAERGT